MDRDKTEAERIAKTRRFYESEREKASDALDDLKARYDEIEDRISLLLDELYNDVERAIVANENEYDRCKRKLRLLDMTDVELEEIGETRPMLF